MRSKKKFGQGLKLRHFLLPAPFLACGLAHADNLNWNVPNGTWDVPSNWDADRVPGATDFANVNSNSLGATAHITDAVPAVNGLFIYNGDTVSIDPGGSINVSVGSSTDSTIGLRIGDGFGGPANSAGTLLINNGTITTTGTDRAADFKIGVTGGTGGTPGHGFVVQNGSLSYAEGQDYVIGQGTNCIAMYTLNAGETHARTWSFIGEDGATGTFLLNGGTFQTDGDGYVGHDLGGNGTLTITGGAYQAGEEINVGEAGGVGEVDQNAGTLQTGTLLSIGRGSGTGTYNLSGGSITTVSSSTAADRDMAIGADPSTHGTLNQTGGTVALGRWGFVGRNQGNAVYNLSAGAYQSNGWLRVAEAGSSGTFNLSGTGTATIGSGTGDLGDDLLVVGVDPGSQGVVNVSGGSLTVVGQLSASNTFGGRIFLGQGGGSGTVNQSGGSVTAQGYISIGTDINGSTRGSGAYLISGGTLTSFTDLNVGDIADGFMQVSSQGYVQATTVWVAHQAGSTGTLNQTGGTINTTAGMQINAGGIYNLSGGVVNAGTFINNGQFNVTGGSPNITAVDGTGSTSVSNGYSFSTNYLRQGTLSLSGNGNLIANASGGTSVVGTLSVGSGSKFDLTNNALVINGTNASDLRALLIRGRGTGNWNGDGLTSSRAATEDATSGPKTGLGYATGAQLGIGSFNGQILAGTAELVRYSYLGDANLDGTVNALDFNALATNYGSGSIWVQGDFNYDGTINSSDFAILAANYNQRPPTPGLPVSDGAAVNALGALVPEPISISIIASGAWMLIGRRRSARRN